MIKATIQNNPYCMLPEKQLTKLIRHHDSNNRSKAYKSTRHDLYKPLC